MQRDHRAKRTPLRVCENRRHTRKRTKAKITTAKLRCKRKYRTSCTKILECIRHKIALDKFIIDLVQNPLCGTRTLLTQRPLKKQRPAQDGLHTPPTPALTWVARQTHPMILAYDISCKRLENLSFYLPKIDLLRALLSVGSLRFTQKLKDLVSVMLSSLRKRALRRIRTPQRLRQLKANRSMDGKISKQN